MASKNGEIHKSEFCRHWIRWNSCVLLLLLLLFFAIASIDHVSFTLFLYIFVAYLSVYRYDCACCAFCLSSLFSSLYLCTVTSVGWRATRSDQAAGRSGWTKWYVTEANLQWASVDTLDGVYTTAYTGRTSLSPVYKRRPRHCHPSSVLHHVHFLSLLIYYTCLVRMNCGLM